MPIDQRISSRFAELTEQRKLLKLWPTPNSSLMHYQPNEWRQWATSAQHIIEFAFGPESVHAEHFRNSYEKCEGFEAGVNALTGIFLAALSDYAAGFAQTLQAQISGEVYGDFVGLARRALNEGFKDVAGVLACAALEDALKRLALMHGIDVADKEMQDIVNALKAKGLLSGGQKTLADAMPKMRNDALHANWAKVTPESVGSVLGFVEPT